MVLLSFMLVVCTVTGVAPVIPKRKEECTVEIKMEQTKRKKKTLHTSFCLIRIDSFVNLKYYFL